MRKECLILAALTLPACSTLNQSFELGAGMGAVAGAAAAATSQSLSGQRISLEGVAIGSGIGMGVGIITSYLVHRCVEDDRQNNAQADIELHYGDLPPSPFIVPKTIFKKGARQ